MNNYKHPEQKLFLFKPTSGLGESNCVRLEDELNWMPPLEDSLFPKEIKLDDYNFMFGPGFGPIIE